MADTGIQPYIGHMHSPVKRPRRTLYPTANQDSEHCSAEHVAFPLPSNATGPTSLMERFQWPQFGWNKMSGADQDRLVCNPKRMLVNDNMSGFSGLHHKDNLGIEAGSIRCASSCNIQGSRRTVLKESEEEGRPECIFGGHLRRLGDLAIVAGQHARHAGEATLEEKREENQQIQGKV